MEMLTEEEAFVLTEHYTANPPKVDPGKARIRIPLIPVDAATAEYLAEKAKATHKTPSEIIGELVRSAIAAAV
jgi:hypothetical protein